MAREGNAKDEACQGSSVLLDSRRPGNGDERKISHTRPPAAVCPDVVLVALMSQRERERASYNGPRVNTMRSHDHFEFDFIKKKKMK